MIANVGDVIPYHGRKVLVKCVYATYAEEGHREMVVALEDVERGTLYVEPIEWFKLHDVVFA